MEKFGDIALRVLQDAFEQRKKAARLLRAGGFDPQETAPKFRGAIVENTNDHGAAFDSQRGTARHGKGGPDRLGARHKRTGRERGAQGGARFGK